MSALSFWARVAETSCFRPHVSLSLPDRDKVLKLLVELLSSSCRDVVTSCLRLTHLLMLRYEWRVSFATEGGVKAILSCMQEFSSVPQVQQLALAVSFHHRYVS